MVLGEEPPAKIRRVNVHEEDDEQILYHLNDSVNQLQTQIDALNQSVSIFNSDLSAYKRANANRVDGNQEKTVGKLNSLDDRVTRLEDAMIHSVPAGLRHLITTVEPTRLGKCHNHRLLF